MKKFLSIFLCVIAILLAFTGCDNSTNNIQENEQSDFNEVMKKVKAANVGSIITFGKYEQDNVSEEKEDIEWIVLDKTDDKLLVISKCLLDTEIPFSANGKIMTWEDSDLRNWLNKDFIQEAFSDEEKEKIILHAVENSSNTEFGTNGGGNTEDKVFLLSGNEVEQYFPENEQRLAEATAYAIDRYDSYHYPADLVEWVLRSPGESELYTQCVNNDGSIGNDQYIGGSSGYIRPAMWIDIK